LCSPLDDRFTGLASPFFPDENQLSVASPPVNRRRLAAPAS
jgi:hypothetical protein